MMDWGFFRRPGRRWRSRCSFAWCQLGRERRFIFEFSLSARWASAVGGGSQAGFSVVGGIHSPFAFRYFSFISYRLLVSCIYSL